MINPQILTENVLYAPMEKGHGDSLSGRQPYQPPKAIENDKSTDSNSSEDEVLNTRSTDRADRPL